MVIRYHSWLLTSYSSSLHYCPLSSINGHSILKSVDTKSWGSTLSSIYFLISSREETDHIAFLNASTIELIPVSPLSVESIIDCEGVCDFVMGDQEVAFLDVFCSGGSSGLLICVESLGKWGGVYIVICRLIAFVDLCCSRWKTSKRFVFFVSLSFRLLVLIVWSEKTIFQGFCNVNQTV